MRLPLPALTALVLAATACTGSSDGFDQPAASAFTEGTCRTAAPDVLSIGRDARRLGKGPEVDKGVLTALTTAQDRVRALAPAAEPQYAKPLTDLATAVGLVRLQAGVGRYQPETGKNLAAKYDAVLQVCT